MPIFPKDQTVITINNNACCNNEEIKEQLDRIESKIDQILEAKDCSELERQMDSWLIRLKVAFDKLEAVSEQVDSTK